MSQQTAYAVGGAAIGFMVAGPAGAQWGFMIGSTVGGLVSAPNMHGPRLTDLTVQQATDAAPIPLAFGAVRIAGNVIQCSPKRERANETSAGKGGPKSTNYTYDVDVAIALCAGPILGVRRIWANGKLIFDATSGATASSLIASGRNVGNIKVYSGSETQMPDPTLEALSGIGKTPAYRGLAYVVISGLQLADYGNTVPNFTFEVVATGSATPFRQIAENTLPHTWKTSSVAGIGRPVVYSIDDVVRVGSAGAVYVYDLDGNYIGLESKTNRENLWPAVPDTYYPGSVGYIVGQLFDGNLVRCMDPLQSPIGGALPTIWINTAFGIRKGLDGPLEAGRQMVTCCMSADQRHILVLTSPNGTAGGGAANKWHLLEWDGEESALIRQGNIDPAAGPGPYTFGPGNCPQIHGSAAMLESGLGVLWSVYGNGGGVYTYAVPQADGGTLTRIYMGSYASINLGFPCYQSIYADNGVCIAVGGGKFAVFTRTPGLEPSPVTLSSIVSTLCQRSGLQAGDIDVTALTDTVHGYVMANQTSARAGIEPLRQFSPFDVVEHDGKLVFVPRGGAQVAQIPWGDLAAHSGADMPDPLTITLADETELPTVVTVAYPSPAADYQIASQTDRRNRVATSGQLWPIAPALNVSRVELAVCMTDAQAARTASVLLWDAFTARKTVKFAVGIQYAGLKASDPVQIVGPDATYNVRITKIDDQGLLRNIEAVFDDGAIYQAAPAAASPLAVPAQSVSLAGPTRLELMDIPLLRDADDGPGYYVAMGRYLPGWSGAMLYTSTDAGATWAELQPVANSAVIGSAATVLAGWSGGNVFDQANGVTVTLPAGLELSSLTELAVLNGGNAALLGNEIIQYTTATLTAPRTYRLTGLLRGRRGTESAMSTHAINERFVLLAGPAGFARIPGAVADIGLARKYKAVSAGSSLDVTSSVDFTPAGQGLKPLAPVHINAGRDAAGNITITWARCTRIAGEWRDGSDVPLGEAAENYDIEIWTPDFAHILRTLTATIPAASWLASEQVVDNDGVRPLELGVKVFQRSATVGRGAPGIAVLSIPASSNTPAATTIEVLGLAGSTLIARSLTFPLARYYSSSNGTSWAQIGTDSPAPPVIGNWPLGIMASLPSGLYVGFQPTRNSGLDTPNWYSGSPSAKPTLTGAQLLSGRWPVCVESDGTKFVAVTEGNRIHHSTDGATWVDKGQMAGDLGFVLGATPAGSINGSLKLQRTATGWLLLAVENRVYSGHEQYAVLRTSDPDAVTGWVSVLDLRSGFSVASSTGLSDIVNPGQLVKAGSRYWISSTGLIGGVMSMITRSSADEGATWQTVAGMSGTPLAANVGPFYVAGKWIYYESAGKGVRTSTDAATWINNTAGGSGYPGMAGWRPVLCDGTRLIVSACDPSNSDQQTRLFVTTDGTSFDLVSGIV